jgi:hypothetical protein
MQRIERMLLVITLLIVGYFFVTRFHDDLVTHRIAVCLATKATNQIDECGVYTKKIFL